ncbi:MAG: winged helix-turn-helix domain-containing protein [Candidatus Njordarchaeales archaeon]
MRRKYRSHVGVLLDILRAIDEEGGANISRIMLKANLPYDRLKFYLEKLVKEGYIVTEQDDEGRIIYKLTEKGVKVLGELIFLKKFFESMGLPL